MQNFVRRRGKVIRCEIPLTVIQTYTNIHNISQPTGGHPLYSWHFPYVSTKLCPSIRMWFGTDCSKPNEARLSVESKLDPMVNNVEPY